MWNHEGAAEPDDGTQTIGLVVEEKWQKCCCRESDVCHLAGCSGTGEVRFRLHIHLRVPRVYATISPLYVSLLDCGEICCMWPMSSFILYMDGRSLQRPA